MRALAGGLEPARDGARAPDLAAGLRGVATELERNAPGVAGHATALIVSMSDWYTAGQLRDGVAAAAADLLRQVPGVQIQTPVTRAARAQAQAPASSAATDPPTTEAPAATAPPRRATTTVVDTGNENGNGKGKAKDN